MSKHLPQTILVVDDDRKTVSLIQLYLENEGFRVVSVYDGRAALQLAHQEHPDLIILDLMLPYVDGLDICHILRQETNVPVIMVTARATEDDKLTGLELGADDYITKPFSPRELVARVKAVLRRTKNHLADLPLVQDFGDLSIDYQRHEVKLEGTLVRLTPREYRLLTTLARQPGRVFTRHELLEKVFGLDYDGLERTVDVHMKNLRKKIELDPASPQYIQTVYGVGYRMMDVAHGV
jgi:DNA-binding response OmpR family regulator